MNTLYSGKQQLFEKLDKMLNNKTDEGEVSLLIDSLRVKNISMATEYLKFTYSSDLVQVVKREPMPSTSSLSKLSILMSRFT